MQEFERLERWCKPRRSVELLEYLRDDGLRRRDPLRLERQCEHERLERSGGELLERHLHGGI